MLQLDWARCGRDGHWCNLLTLELSSVAAPCGVYMIFRPAGPVRVVRTGKGNIRARLAAHRKDPDILRHGRQGRLLVTWAALDPARQDGVERYLAERYPPLVGTVFPDAPPIAVNLPWDARRANREARRPNRRDER